MKIDGTDKHRVSTGTGRTTCGYYYPGGKSILFASTHEASTACPPKPSYDKGYVWPIYAGYDIYRAERRRLEADAADADARLRRRGDHRARRADRVHQRARRRHGDLLDEGRRLRRQAADQPSRARRRAVLFVGRQADRVPRPAAAAPGRSSTTISALLKEGLWRPTQLELFVMDRDGSNLRQVTKLGGAELRAVVASRTASG